MVTRSSIISQALVDELVEGVDSIDCPCDWQNYELLLFMTGIHYNVQETILYPTFRFANTGSTNRAILTFAGSDVEIYQDGEGYIVIEPNSPITNQRLWVYGLFKRA